MIAPASDASVRFDNASRDAHNHRSIPKGGTPRAMREAAEATGLDPLPHLYNEALQFATEGHLRLARERLQMLLCMAPDDGEARLLLAKVYVAGQRWPDALSCLDEAENCGMSVPMELRELVEMQVQAEHAESDEQRASVNNRERGEIKALRAEARRLRSENAQLGTTVTQLEGETRKWAWVATGVSVVAMLFIATSLVFGGSSVPESVVSVESDPVAPAADAVVDATGAAGAAAAAGTPATGTPAAAAPADDRSVAGLAAGALAASEELDGTQLEVVIDQGKAELAGQVISARQRLRAKRIVGAVKGIESVGTDRVEVLARTRGTVHTVARGETLGHIAGLYYGNVALASRILKANPGNKTLHIGDELKIPAVD